VVEEAGYPEDPDPAARVVRDGRVIATVERSATEGSATYGDGQV
jgi:hypothetical protein